MKTVTLRKRVGRALRRHREATGMSQETFAPMADMHRTYYSSIERGVKNVTLETLERVCKALNVPMWVVLKDAGDPGALKFSDGMPLQKTRMRQR